MTLKLDKFHTLMERYGGDAVPVPCPGLVELIEAGETNGPRLMAKLMELLAPHLNQPVKAVVLGCTHYVFVKPALRAILPKPVALVDGNRGTARQLRNRLAQKGLLREESNGGNVVFLSTAEDEAIPDRMREWFRKALAALDSPCISPNDAVE